MANGNGRPDAPDEDAELPPGLSAWFAIEECVGETLDALRALPDETGQAVAFLARMHAAVKVWLSWELWACLLDSGQYSPDSLLESLLDRGVDVRQLPRSGPATPPQTGRAIEWRAFEGSEDRG
jgi:hypothetical protein